MVLEIGIPKTIGLPIQQNHARRCLVRNYRNFKKLIQTIVFEMMKFFLVDTLHGRTVSDFLRVNVKK